MASLWFLIAIVFTPLKIGLLSTILLIRIIIKLGIFPFHGWFFSVIGVSSWIFFFIFSSIQKIIPLVVLRNILINLKLFYVMVSLSLFFIFSIDISYLSSRLILTLSSINNVSWILISLICSKIFWGVFITIYMFILFPIIKYLSRLNLNFSNMLFPQNTPMGDKLIVSLMVISLGGLPPLLGFFNKFMIIKLFLFKIRVLVIMLIIFSSLFLLYYYISLVFSSLSFYPGPHTAQKRLDLRVMKLMFLISFIPILIITFINY